MSGPEPRAGVLVEERLAEYSLYLGQLVHPDNLGQVAELAVEHVAREVGVYLGGVAVAEGVVEHTHGVERYGYDVGGLGREEAVPYVAVAPDLEVAQVGLLAPLADGFGDGLEHLVVGVGTAALRVEGDADHGRLDGAQLLEDGGHVTLTVGLLGEDVTGVEAQAEVMHVLVLDAEESPYQFFLELADHTLEQADVSGHLLAVVAVAGLVDHVENLGTQFLFVLHTVDFDEVAYQTVRAASLALFFVSGSNVDQRVVDVFLPFEFPSLGEEVGIVCHLDSACIEETYGLVQGVDKEVVGHGVEAGGHYREV